MKSLVRVRCLTLLVAFVTLGTLPTTYSFLERLLLRYGEARLAIGITYPTAGTRIVGMLSAAAAAAGLCMAWRRLQPTRNRSLVAFGALAAGFLAVMLAIGLIVRSMTLEYYPNEAAVRWFIPVALISLLAGAASSIVERLRGR